MNRRGRWKAGKDTWNAFAGFPCQVDSGMGHLAHFRGISVPGGSREMPPDTVRIRIRVRFRVRVNVRARAGQV